METYAVNPSKSEVSNIQQWYLHHSLLTLKERPLDMDAAKLYNGRAMLPCDRLAPATFVDTNNCQEALGRVIRGKGV
jgi:hypothetical protein